MNDLLIRGTWRRASDIAVVDHEDRVVALNLTRPADPPVVLEGTAATIWHLMDQDGHEEALIAAVARAFGQYEVDVAADVHAFLSHLRSLGLVTTSGDPS